MGSIYFEAKLDVSAAVAWDYLDRYMRAEVFPFSSGTAKLGEDGYRVITAPGGFEVRERNVTVDPVHRRAVYTLVGLPGVDHHQAELRVEAGSDGAATLAWVTDYLPHELAEQRAASQAPLFDEVVAAVNAHDAAADGH